jgi:hypothetical protein
MCPPSHDRDLYRAESAELADQVIQLLRSTDDLFLPSTEIARTLGVNPNRLGHTLRRHPNTFQLERTYRAGALITVVALRPSQRASSSSTP